MNFKILVGDKGNVDFDGPIEMTNKEREKFIDLLKTLFTPSVIEEQEVTTFRDWRMNEDRVQYPRSWTAEEYEVLLRTYSIDEAIDKLGRSGMAIIVQDGLWRPEFFSWCHEKGKNPIEGNIIQVIKEFMKEKDHEILSRRENKKKIRKKQKEIESLQDELKVWDSDKKRSQIDLAVRLGQLKDTNVDEYIKSKKREITLKIEQLKKELDQGSPNS